jgi:predicted transcriptional regulator of viral defense system
MDFERLLELVEDEPVFESALLLAGNIEPRSVRLQLSRWTNAGRIYQLRRELYAIAPPYQKVKPHPFVVANHLQRASYVSVQSALAFYGMIPEALNATVSMTAGRPERLQTPLGVFEFRHIQPSHLRGYCMTDLNGQQALVATPEKALFDLIYLRAGGETAQYLGELRLQNLDGLSLDVLRKQAETFGTGKMNRAVEVIAQLAQNETREYEEL